jgi:hypothetical protein
MRRFIALLANSYGLSYLVAYVALVVYTSTRVTWDVAVSGNLFYAIFFGMAVNFVCYAIDDLLPPSDRETPPSPDPEPPRTRSKIP